MVSEKHLFGFAEEYQPVCVKGKKVYVAGPMTGLPDLNRGQFYAAEEYLTELGARVMNPAVLPEGFEWEEYMSIAIPMMKACHVVAFLPGWENSKGAKQEYSESGDRIRVALSVGHTDGVPWVTGHRPLMG